MFKVIILLLFSTTLNAGQFITEDDLIRANNNNPPYTLHQKTLEKCEQLEGKKCYDVTGLELDINRINMFGFVVEDVGLIAQRNAKILTRQQRDKIIIDRNERLVIALSNFNSLNQIQKDSALKDLLDKALND